MNPSNVTTGEVRFSFVHIFKPYAYVQGQTEKFSVTVLVPKTDVETKARIDQAIEAAKQRGLTDKWNGAMPPVLGIPVYDGDGVKTDGTPFTPECHGHWVFTASSNVEYPPEVVDLQGNPIITPSAVYSGCYGRVNVTFFPYMFGGKKGIGCSLGPVQKTRDGEMLGGGVPRASDVFGTGGNNNRPIQQQPAYGGYQQASPQPANQAYTQPQGGINPITGMPY